MPGIDLSLEKTGQFFGVDPRTVSNWIRNGCPGKKDSKNRWALNSADVSEWLRSRERESALGDVVQVDEQEARRRKLAAEAALAEHELALKQGSAVAIADFQTQMAGMIGAARAKLLNLGAKIGPLVLGAASPAEAKGLIDGAVREILAELSEFDGNVPEQPESEEESSGVGQAGGEAMGATSGPDDKRVGRRKPKAVRGG